MAGVTPPAPVTGKRKRDEQASTGTTLQIITGSYEKVLHGFTVTIPTEATSDTSPTFTDTFLFNAHTAAIRCLALSPSSSSKRFLASGSSDERINLYQLNTVAPKYSKKAKSGSSVPLQPSRNKELGSLMHHSAPITALRFPTHSKLISTSIDNNIGITRSRDWTLLTTIHAPIPKTTGRPSGDTFAPGEVPAGINDLAVHPSSRLAISVGIGEKCMRLWNLVTGKKAGVLMFERNLLSEIGEGKFRGGEGKTVSWRDDGEEFAIGFERGLIIYNLDCTVKGIISLGLRQRLCKTSYLPSLDVLAVSTEDGRVLFFDTTIPISSDVLETNPPVTHCQLIAQLGTSSSGSGNRIKDFQAFSQAQSGLLIVTVTSDGNTKIWKLSPDDFAPKSEKTSTKTSSLKNGSKDGATRSEISGSTPIGTLLGSYETGRRVTCLTGFVMDFDGDMPQTDKATDSSAASLEDNAWNGL